MTESYTLWLPSEKIRLILTHGVQKPEYAFEVQQTRLIPSDGGQASSSP